ncbi:SLC13 family permease [Archangium sp.]|uniref:SLC13 family permease n=1 Tax=Archangium sp. TaxID=1872627 RepID=UPI002D3B5EC0|nr:SLC13 family permease [Archangium sp.]HYO55972.1 SLC13 family permease [Archangium sp.]
MNSTVRASRPLLLPVLTVALLAGLTVACWLLPLSSLHSRAAWILGGVLILWLLEVVPPFVPTLLLLAVVPLLLQGGGTAYRLPELLRGAMDPVLALFFGGFALSAAASRHGIDGSLAQLVVRLSRGHCRALVVLVAGATALLSMWMSNIAAAAMMLAALRPLHAGRPEADGFRRALLLAVAVGANFGGMATPIGTGPNAIALSALEPLVRITFLRWMLIGVPLTLCLVVAGLALVLWRFRVRGQVELPSQELTLSLEARGVMGLFFLAVAAWLSEPLHGVPAGVVALAASGLLFGLGLLKREDLGRLDWSTLLLISGGILLGKLLEESGLVSSALAHTDAARLPPAARLFGWVFVSATLSALMSNTATATMLIPLAAQLDPGPATPILVAMGCSLGTPVVISTPPTARVHGEGGITSGDLLAIGGPLMLLGALAISLTGPSMLELLGVG